MPAGFQPQSDSAAAAENQKLKAEVKELTQELKIATARVHELELDKYSLQDKEKKEKRFYRTWYKNYRKKETSYRK